MNDVDGELRALLAERAAAIPPASGLVGAVHRRKRRIRRRRLAFTGVAAVLVLLAGLAVAWRTDRDDRLVPTAPTGAAPPPSPVSVGPLPAGFTPPQVALVANQVWSIKSIRRTPLAQLTIRVSATPLTGRTGLGTRRTVLIDGVRASLYSVPLDLGGARPTSTTPPTAQRPMIELTYRRAPGQWIQIDVHNVTGAPDLGVTTDDVERIAAGLVDRPMPVPDLLRFPPLPSGVVYGDVWDKWDSSGAQVQFVDPAAPPRPTDLPGGGHATYSGDALLIVDAGPGSDLDMGGFPTGPGHNVRIDGRFVKVFARDGFGRHTVVAPFGDDQFLVVSAAQSLHLTDVDLARFAFGTRRGSDYR